MIVLRILAMLVAIGSIVDPALRLTEPSRCQYVFTAPDDLTRLGAVGNSDSGCCQISLTSARRGDRRHRPSLDRARDSPELVEGRAPYLRSRMAGRCRSCH